MKLALVALAASENAMFASADHNARPEISAFFSVRLQFEAVSNQ
jgi:hypothetical protein